MRKFVLMGWVAVLVLFTGCQESLTIVNDVDERSANEIIVFLASQQIDAEKAPSTRSSGGSQDSGALMWNITVDKSDRIDAMAVLSRNGLPRRMGTNLLELFSKQGLMSSDKEETIRYQAGLESQIANTLLKFDGVLDAEVKLSFPPTDTSSGLNGPQKPQRITAAVYIKSTGIINELNLHYIPKIKQLVSASVYGLDINDVIVVSDVSRFTDVSVGQTPEAIVPLNQDHVSVWSIIMAKESVSRFRFVFFTLLVLNTVFLALVGWLIWKFYPIIRKNGGLSQLFKPIPMDDHSEENEE